MDVNTYKKVKKLSSQVVDVTRQVDNISMFSPALSLGDLFQKSLSMFLEPQKGLDIEKPARTYTIQFTLATATTALVIPLYDALTSIGGTDNDTFNTDKAYVSEIISVNDLTADPSGVTNLLSSFARGTKTITLSSTSDNTSRTWQIVCIGVPYQGLISQIIATPTDTAFRIVHDPGKMLVASDGANTNGLSPIIAKLPLDGSNDFPYYSGSIKSISASAQQSVWEYVPWVHMSNNMFPSSYLLSFSNIAGGRRGLRGDNGIFQMYGVYLPTVPASYVVAYLAIVEVVRLKDNAVHDALFQNGELLLLVATRICTASQPIVNFSTDPNMSADVFRLPNRPILNGEVWQI